MPVVSRTWPRILAVAACALPGMVGAPDDARAVVLNDAAATAAGGITNYYDSTNAFPNVVSIYSPATGSYCTGSLINSRTILTAAHCLYETPSATVPPLTVGIGATDRVSFSPNITANPQPSNGITGAIANAGYNGTAPVNDIAMISLATPVTTITPVTLIQPGAAMPAVGATIIMVGYGGYGTGTAPPTSTGPIDGKRRVGFSELGAYAMENGQFFYQAQFRNPLSPGNPDVFGLNAMGIATQPLEAGVAQGDSGGPLFVQTANGLIEVGEVQGGSGGTPSNGYGEQNNWTPVALFSNWIAVNNPLRQTSSNAGAFNWSNAAAWTDSAPGGPAPVVPNNTAGPATNFPTALAVAYYYNVTLANAGTITTDISPTIDSLQIAGAQSQLTISPNTVLTTVVGSGMSAGTLLVNGGLSTQNLSLTGGLMTGIGTVTATGGVVNAGAVSPGTAAALGTLTIQGNYTQTSAGALNIRLGSTSSDKLVVGGAAVLGGTLQLSGNGQPYTLGTKYSVVTANTLSGTFATTNGGALTAFLGAAPSYSTTGLQLSVIQTQSLAAGATTPDQVAVAKALDKSASTDTGTLGTAVSDLLNSPPAQADQGLNQLGADGNGGGDVVGNYLTGDMAAARLVGNALDEHLALLRADNAGTMAAAGLSGMQYSFGSRAGAQLASVAGGGLAAADGANPAAPNAASPYKLWAHGIGGWENLRSDGDAPGMTQSIGGVIAGIDMAPFAWLPSFKGGAAFSFTSGDLSGGGESGTTNAYRFTFYGTQSLGPAYIEGRVGYGRDDIGTTRFISFDALDQTANASTTGDEVSTRLATGYGFALGRFSIEPSAAIAFDYVSQNGYSESGDGTLGLNVGSSSLDSLRLSVGARGTTTIDLGNGFVASPTAEARFEEHVLNEMPSTTMSFIGAAADPFTIDGVKPGQQSALLNTGVTVGNGNGVAVFAAYTAELRTHETTQALMGGLRITW